MIEIDTGAEQSLPDLTEAPAWPVLRKHLARLALPMGPVSVLKRLRPTLSEGELTTANDPAAVLDWRLQDRGAAAVGPLRWLPDIPPPLRDNQQLAPRTWTHVLNRSTRSRRPPEGLQEAL